VTVVKAAQPESTWLSAIRAVLPWMIPATLCLYIKMHLMNHEQWMHGGYYIVAKSLGRVRLTLWDRLSFYRADLLLAFLLIPLGLLLASRYLLPRRWRMPFVILFSSASTIIMYLQLTSFNEAGEFLSIRVMSAAISWGFLHDRSAIFVFLSLKPLAAMAGPAAVMIAWRWLTNWRIRTRGTSISARSWYIGATAVFSCLIAITVSAWLSPFPATPFHKNVIGWMLQSLADRTEAQTLEFVDLSEEQLQNQYRAMTYFPGVGRDTNYWAKAKGCNVLFFVLETAPARVLPAGGDLSDYPNIQRLREKSLVGVSHYATFPSTHQAVFSILSSLYPSAVMDSLQGRQPDLAVPGLIATLSELGYDTALYSPINFKAVADSEMYKSLGFRRQIYPQGESDKVDFFSSFDSVASARFRMSLDVATLSLLKRDLERDLTEGRQFAYLFQPEVSHGPWADLKEDGKELNIEKRGRNLLEIPDQMLGEIMEVLQRHDQLENTVIVVVGDHGIRDPIEDPNLPSGVIDDYSFHVPLFIYAPKAINHMVEIPYVTSHIDIAPSIESLLGIAKGKRFEQGAPLWDPDLVNRTTFFFGRDFLGADGYSSRGQFFMWSPMSDTVYQNTHMSFDAINIVGPNSPVHKEVIRGINRMAGLNEVWAMHLSGAASPHKQLALASKR